MAAPTSSDSRHVRSAATADAHADFRDGIEGAALLRDGQRAALDAWLADLRNKHGDGQHAGKKRRIANTVE